VIRFAFRWLFRLVLVGAVAFTALVLTKDVLLREWMIYRVRKVTGLETRLDAIQTGLLAGTLTLTGLRLYNTAEFGGGTLLDMPDLHVELDLGSLRDRTVGFSLARLNVAELNVVRSQDGRTNLVELITNLQEQSSLMEKAILGHPGMEFSGIATLNLTVGTVRFVNLAQPARNREIDARITNQVVRNVKSAADLTPLLLRVLFRELNESLDPRRRSPKSH
jgi:hypothetical protein